MSSFLTEKLKEDFYITLYFNISEGFENIGLKSTYLEFNRTLKIKDGILKSQYNLLENYENSINTYITNKISNSYQFYEN